MLYVYGDILKTSGYNKSYTKTGGMIMSYGLIAVIIVIGIVIGAIATKKCEPF